MDQAKHAVNKIIGRSGQHDTVVDEHVRPAVTEEHVKPHRHEETQQAIDKEVHQDHYHTTVQPLHHKEVLPEKHIHQQAPVQEREFRHGDHEKIRSSVETEAAQFANKSTTHSTSQSASQAAAVTGEHVHHHVHETVQPIIHKESVRPEVVHTTVPIHETHHAQAEHHGISTLPTKTLDEFNKLGGKITGASHRHEEYDGHPRPYNPEMQSNRSDADTNFGKHDGLHGSHGTSGTGIGHSTHGTSGTGLGHSTHDNRGTGLGQSTHGTSGTGLGHSSHETSGTGLGHSDRGTSGTGLGHSSHDNSGTNVGHGSNTGSNTGSSGIVGKLKEAVGVGSSSGTSGSHSHGANTGTSGTSGSNVSGSGPDYNTGSGMTSGGMGSTGTALGGRTEGNTVGRAVETATGHGSSGIGGIHSTGHTGTGGSHGLTDRSVDHATTGHNTTGGIGTHHDRGLTDTSSSTRIGGSDHTRAVGSDDVQSSHQGKDPSLVETGGSNLKGSAVDGSHSAVFGLTPDGHKHDDTTHGQEQLQPAHSKRLGDSNSSVDNGSRAPTGSNVAQQMDDPRVNQKGHSGLQDYNNSSTKPGAGSSGLTQGFGQVAPGQHGATGSMKNKLDPTTDADGDGKRGFMD